MHALQESLIGVMPQVVVYLPGSKQEGRIHTAEWRGGRSRTAVEEEFEEFRALARPCSAQQDHTLALLAAGDELAE